jgi:hypothetical protein
LKHSELTLGVKLKTKQLFRTGQEIPIEFRQRVTNIYADYRLCSSGPIVFDPETGLEFAILLTDQMIYAVYSRATILFEPTMSTAHFCHVKEIWRRSGADPEPLRVSIGLNAKADYVRYYIEGEMVWEVTHLGRRLGLDTVTKDNSVATIKLNPKQVYFGLGHFSLLDHQFPGSSKIFSDTTTEIGVTIPRAASGLCRLYPDTDYREIIPDMLGRQINIRPDQSFAAPLGMPNHRFFDQGIQTTLSDVFILEKRLGYEKIDSEYIY